MQSNQQVKAQGSESSASIESPHPAQEYTVKDLEGNTATLTAGLVLYGRREYGRYSGKHGQPLSNKHVVTDFWLGIRGAGYDAKTRARAQSYLEEANERNPGAANRLAIKGAGFHLNASQQADGTYLLSEYTDSGVHYLTPVGDVL